MLKDLPVFQCFSKHCNMHVIFFSQPDHYSFSKMHISSRWIMMSFTDIHEYAWSHVDISKKKEKKSDDETLPYEKQTTVYLSSVDWLLFVYLKIYDIIVYSARPIISAYSTVPSHKEYQTYWCGQKFHLMQSRNEVLHHLQGIPLPWYDQVWSLVYRYDHNAVMYVEPASPQHSSTWKLALWVIRNVESIPMTPVK